MCIFLPENWASDGNRWHKVIPSVFKAMVTVTIFGTDEPDKVKDALASPLKVAPASLADSGTAASSSSSSSTSMVLPTTEVIRPAVREKRRLGEDAKPAEEPSSKVQVVSGQVEQGDAPFQVPREIHHNMFPTCAMGLNFFSIANDPAFICITGRSMRIESPGPNRRITLRGLRE